jgi:uncharacterized protein (TIGR02246 family)
MKAETPDPHLRQQLDAKIKKYDEAFNKNDAGVVAAFFTEDAVLVTNEGPIQSRDAIEKHFPGSVPERAFQQLYRQGRSGFPPIL